MVLLGVWIYLINLIVRPQDWVSWMYRMPVDYVVIIATVLSGLLFREKSKPLVKLPHYYLVCAYIFMIFLSNAVHGQVGVGIKQFIDFFKLVIIFFMFPIAINAPKKMGRTLKLIAVLSAILAYQGLFQTTHEGVGWAGQSLYSGWVRQGFQRITWVGQWDGANIFAFILLITTPFFLEDIFRKSNFLVKMFNAAGAAFIVYGVYLTNSRGGYISLMVIFCCYSWLKFKKRYSIFLTLLLLAAAVLFAPSRMSELNTEEASAYHRTWIWKEGVFMLMHNPLFGVGKGFFEDYSYHHLRAHNSFVQTFAETGMVGFFCWLGVIYFCFKSLRQIMKIVPRNNNDSMFVSMARGLFVSFIGFNVCALFITIESAILYVWFGLCAALANIFANNYPEFDYSFSAKDTKNIFKSMVGVFLLVFVLAFVRII